MSSPDQEEKSSATPLDAEREQLRKAGYTDAEVSQILIARAASQQPTGIGQGAMSNVLSSILGVASHARMLIPTFRKDVVTIFDGTATGSVRAGATASLAVKAIVVVVLGYAAWQEWQIHINYGSQQAAAQAQKASAEAGVAQSVAAGERAKADAQSLLLDREHPEIRRWIPEVEPQAQADYATCTRENESLHELIGACTRILTQGTAKNPTTLEFIYLARGRAYVAGHENDRAVADYTEALKIDPYNEQIYNFRGIAYMGMPLVFPTPGQVDQKNYDLAMADFSQAIALKPKYWRPYYNRGLIYRLKDDNAHMQADFAEAERLKSQGN